MSKKKPVMAWAGFSDGKLYFRHSFDISDKPFNARAEACLYQTKAQAKIYFKDVRRVSIREVPRSKRGRK